MPRVIAHRKSLNWSAIKQMFVCGLVDVDSKGIPLPEISHSSSILSGSFFEDHRKTSEFGGLWSQPQFSLSPVLKPSTIDAVKFSKFCEKVSEKNAAVIRRRDNHRRMPSLQHTTMCLPFTCHSSVSTYLSAFISFSIDLFSKQSEHSAVTIAKVVFSASGSDEAKLSWYGAICQFSTLDSIINAITLKNLPILILKSRTSVNDEEIRLKIWIIYLKLSNWRVSFCNSCMSSGRARFIC